MSTDRLDAGEDGFQPDYRLRPCDGPGCREVFEPKNAQHRHCSEPCRKRAYWERKARKIEEPIIKAVRSSVRRQLTKGR